MIPILPFITDPTSIPTTSTTTDGQNLLPALSPALLHSTTKTAHTQELSTPIVTLLQPHDHDYDYDCDHPADTLSTETCPTIREECVSGNIRGGE